MLGLLRNFFFLLNMKRFDSSFGFMNNYVFEGVNFLAEVIETGDLMFLFKVFIYDYAKS